MKDNKERKVGETYFKRVEEGCPLEEITVISSTKQSIEDIKNYLKTKSTAKCFSEKYDLNTGKRKDSDD